MLLTSFLFAASTLAPASAPPIVIRHDVSDAEYLVLARDYPSVCQVGVEGVGVLIAPRWILTASHVADAVGPFSAKVAFGGRGSGHLLRSLAVDQVFLHPDYGRDDVSNDIALLRLAEPAQGIVPVPLNTDTGELGQKIVLVSCGAVGTGLTGAVEGDGLWRAATNTVLEATETQLRFRFDAPGSAEVTDLEGFWGSGDSGCPAFIETGGKLFVAGVSSHGYGETEGGFPAQYGQRDVSYRVSHYVPWIREVLQKQATTPSNIDAPRPIVDGQLPETPLGKLAAAYFDARGSDEAAREAFALEYVDLPPDAPAGAVVRRIWKSDVLPAGLGPYTAVEFVERPGESIVVLTSVPQIDERLAFTFRSGKDLPVTVSDVQVLPVAP